MRVRARLPVVMLGIARQVRRVPGAKWLLSREAPVSEFRLPDAMAGLVSAIDAAPQRWLRSSIMRFGTKCYTLDASDLARKIDNLLTGWPSGSILFSGRKRQGVGLALRVGASRRRAAFSAAGIGACDSREMKARSSH